MSAPGQMKRRRFDHDEAARRKAAGESVASLASEYGVTEDGVRQALRRSKPGGAAKENEYKRIWQQKRFHRPCLRGCGRLAWYGPQKARTGVCRVCTGLENRTAGHGTERRYVSGCRCDACRAAQTAARRARRERSHVPCSHGCGTLVDPYTARRQGKPPECQPCALQRIHAERRAA